MSDSVLQPTANASPTAFRPNTWLLTILLAALAMLGPYSTDAYLPAFPDIGKSLGATPMQVQQTLSLYLLAFGSMTLFHGTLSDSFGRRRVILVTLTVYVLASIGTVLANALPLMIVFRVVQGLSIGSGAVVGRAMIRDLFAGTEAQKVMAQMTMIYGIAPAIAPVLGAGMLHLWGWRSIFAMLVILGCLLLATSWWKLPESLPLSQRQPFHFKALVGHYWDVSRSRPFQLLAFANGFACSGYFLYICSAPAFVTNVLHLSKGQIGWVCIPMICGLIGGAHLAGRMAGRMKSKTVLGVAYALLVAGSAANFLYNFLAVPSVPWAMLPLVLYTVGAGLAAPNLTLLNLDMFPSMRGLASSVQAAVQMFLYAAVAGILSPLLFDSGMLLAIGLLVLLSISIGCWLLYTKQMSAL